MNKNDSNNCDIKNIIYKGVTYRVYNELTCDPLITFHLETSFKWHELIEKFNFKIYFLKSSSLLNLKISLEGKHLSFNNPDLKEIKFLQSNDLYYLYMNLYYEVLYFIPYIDNNNNYSYNLVVLIKNDFNIEKISNHNFNLIKIIDCVEIKKENINYGLIEEIFNFRIITKNFIPFDSINSIDTEHRYKIPYYGFEDYSREFNIKEENIDYDKYKNTKFIKHFLNFNQNLYAYSHFRCICTQIWSFDGKHYIEENRYGKTYGDVELYNINSGFFTNFDELTDVKIIKTFEKDFNIEDSQYFSSCLYDNYDELSINGCSFSKEFVKNGFINFENKKIIKVENFGESRRIFKL